VQKDAKMRISKGWKGDSHDALLYQNVLNEFNTQIYFQRLEELLLIASNSAREYIAQMNTILGISIGKLKKCVISDGLLRDAYVTDIMKDGRKRKIAGTGLNEIIKKCDN
jgi:hypothetical protein